MWLEIGECWPEIRKSWQKRKHWSPGDLQIQEGARTNVLGKAVTASAKALGQAEPWHIQGTKKWWVPLDYREGRIIVPSEVRVDRVTFHRDFQARAKGLEFYPSVMEAFERFLAVVRCGFMYILSRSCWLLCGERVEGWELKQFWEAASVPGRSNSNLHQPRIRGHGCKSNNQD